VAVETRERRNRPAPVQVIWSPAGLCEIEHIYRYIAQFGPRAAERMVMEILAAGDSLETFPQWRAAPTRSGARRTQGLVGRRSLWRTRKIRTWFTAMR
jgi:plasmid stabilization system protein ParE